MMFADKEKCKRCGACFAECPYQLVVTDNEGFPKLRLAAKKMCIGCGHCVAVCPVGALSLPELPVLSALGPEHCGQIPQNVKIDVAMADQFLQSRRSIRTYKKKCISHDILEDLLNVAAFAPSAKNGQPTQWIMTNGVDMTQELVALTVQYMAANSVFPGIVKNWEKGIDTVLHNAPHIAIAHALEDGFHPTEDCSLAVAYLELAAHARGIGACWAGFLMEAAAGCHELRARLQIPEGHRVYAALMLGYPKYRYARVPRRKDIADKWLD